MNSPTDKLRTLIKVTSEVEAAILVAALAEHQIKAVSTGALTAGFRAEAPGMVSIMVEEDDLAIAQTALQQVQQGQSEIDWSQVDVGDAEE